MSGCIVEQTQRALRQDWRAAETSARSRRAALARATRLVTEIVQGRALAGHLKALWQLVDELSTLSPESASLLAATLERDAEIWRAHVEDRHCEAGTCFVRPTAPCHAACPAHIDIPDFIALIGHGRHSEAIRVITTDSPLPYSCGLVCPAPCESACVRGAVEASLFIRPMKAVAARHTLAEGTHYPLPEVAAPTGKRVAVAGSGPAGMTAAWYLAIAGHKVEIFETAAEAGGMMRYGIPAYRLPPEVLDAELSNLRALGVDIHTSHPVTSLTALKAEGFDAVFAALGLQLSRRIPIEGVEQPFVLGGVDFLREVREGKNPRVGPRALVIGGGNVAIDVALSALRQGASHVDLVCLESRAEMPANPAEVAIALEEGVVINNSWGPVRIGADNQIVFQRCTRVFDDQRRFAPAFEPSETLTLEADQVLLAVGQAADLTAIEGSAIRAERGLIAVDRNTLATAEPGIFAGGDIAYGPRTVVEAVRSGKQAAASIDAYLMERPAEAAWSAPHRRATVAPLSTIAAQRSSHDRPHMPECDVGERLGDYRPIELGLTDAMATDEASRCLRCDMCIGCGLCELVCSEMGAEALRMVDTGAGRLAFDDFKRPAELCLGCGACAQACPMGAISIEDSGGMRNTVITGTVVRQQKLITCPDCGQPYVAEHLLNRLHAETTPETGAVCPTCTRARRSRAIAAMVAAE